MKPPKAIPFSLRRKMALQAGVEARPSLAAQKPMLNQIGECE